MSQLLNRQPFSDHIRFEPFDVNEIDKHPDRGKLWATIHYVEELARENGWSEGYKEGYRDGKYDAEIV